MGSIFHRRRMPDPVPLPPVPPPPPSPVLSGEKSDGNPVVTPTLRLGLNVHRLTPEHITLCRRLGVTQVRTTVYVNEYGLMPDGALVGRLDPIEEALRQTAAVVPIWCTEFGIAPRDIRRAWPLDDPTKDGPRICREWQAVSDVCTELGVQRAYGYCLDADEGAGYGIAGTPTADWLQRTQGGTV
jgi:hypothetical protein